MTCFSSFYVSFLFNFCVLFCFGGSNEPFNSNQVIKCDRIDEKTQGMEISVKNDINEQPFLALSQNKH